MLRIYLPEPVSGPTGLVGRGQRAVAVGLLAGDLAHGVVEGETEDLDGEVDGVAGQVALGPASEAVFEDEAGTGSKALPW